MVKWLLCIAARLCVVDHFVFKYEGYPNEANQACRLSIQTLKNVIRILPVVHPGYCIWPNDSFNFKGAQHSVIICFP